MYPGLVSCEMAADSVDGAGQGLAALGRPRCVRWASLPRGRILPQAYAPKARPPQAYGATRRLGGLSPGYRPPASVRFSMSARTLGSSCS
jgi:hypothetical protein